MTRRDFIRHVSAFLKDNGKRKVAKMPAHQFTISDDDGNEKKFYVRKKDRVLLYNVDDVEAVIDACIEVAKDLLKKGDSLSFRGIGTLNLAYRKPRTANDLINGGTLTVPARYTPKFTFGKEMKMCGRAYEMSLEEKLNNPKHTTLFEDLDEDESGLEDGE